VTKLGDVEKHRHTKKVQKQLSSGRQEELPFKAVSNETRLVEGKTGLFYC
jgi:hypothetical protein